MRILYVSDSLGAPIHPRGIFNYSISLVEMLKRAGATVDLVVEGSMDYSLEGQFGGLIEMAPDAVNSARLSEIYRYFSQAEFSFRWSWGYRSATLKRLANRSRRLVAAWLRLREQFNYRPLVRVKNDPQGIDFVPAKGEHLSLFDHLVVKRNFYSSSMSRANLGLPPPWIDASGYDLAILDTPHFVHMNGIGSERILTVLHDLIPLRDPTMDAHWRNLFIRKLEATLAMRANIIFVSRYTQRTFHAAFPNHAPRREYILFPAIRRQLLADGAKDFDGGPSEREDESALLWSKVKAAQRAYAGRVAEESEREPAPPTLPTNFDASLPFFVTAISDEPRKNIATLVRAFSQELRGRANVVILGQINVKRYAAEAPNIFFPGYVTDEEKISYFRGAHGVVFASLSEGFGIPIIEGGVMRLPVLCSDIEVFREVAGDEAFYFDPRSSASIAKAVIEVLANPHAARERGWRLRQSVVSRFSQDAVGENVRAALAELCA